MSSESSTSIEDRIAALPPLAEAMSARDLGAHIRALEALMGGKFGTLGGPSIYAEARHGTADLSIYPAGITGRGDEPRTHIKAAAWPEAFALARAWIANHTTVHRDNRIRAMALAIIDLTDQHGRCDRAMLRRREFSDAEIDTIKDAACQRASEMSANAPFAVEG